MTEDRNVGRLALSIDTTEAMASIEELMQEVLRVHTEVNRLVSAIEEAGALARRTFPSAASG